MTEYTRSFALDDVKVRPGAEGRIVEAYAAVFDSPTRVVDQDGEYEEIIDKTMFNRALGMARRSQGGGWSIPVMYNHGQTLFGTASDRHAVPIGIPEDIRPDGKGLYTRTRFHKTELANEVLEAISEGSIRSYSFSGVFTKSDPMPPPTGFRSAYGGRLQQVRRVESTLREFGPTPFAVYPQAEVIGVRAEQAALFLNRLSPDEFERLLLMVRSGTPAPAAEAALLDQPPSPEVRSESEPASAADQPPVPVGAEHSDRLLSPREAILAKRAAWIIKQKAEEHAVGE